MPGARISVIGVLCVLATAGCSGERASESISQARGAYRSPSPAPDLRCKHVVRVSDAAGDIRSVVRGRQLRVRSAVDLRRFELMADKEGVCARWTTASRPLQGTSFHFNVYGPPYRLRRPDVIVLHGHGFEVALTAEGPRVRDAAGSTTLRAQVSRSPHMVSVFVPRAQLDRPRQDLPERPPFPYRAFAFDTRVFGPADERGRQTMDIWPQETEGQAGWVSGRMCLPDCQERRAIGSARKYPPDDASRQDGSD